MAKRASLNKQQAESLLNMPKDAGRPPETGDNALLDHIGEGTLTTQRIVEEVPLSRIRPNPFQPRWAVDEATVAELVHSIEQRGFYGTLTARSRGRWYELAYGHQRLEAAQRANLATLPLEVKELTDEEMLEYALSENLQRKDLSQLEEGEMFERWQNELGRSEREIAERLGKSRGYVRNRIETARLPADLKEVLRAQTGKPPLTDDEEKLSPSFELSAAAAKELARVEDGDQRYALTQEVLARTLNFRQTKALVEQLLQPARTITPTKKEEPGLFEALMNRLEQEAQRVPREARHDAIRALDELIARAEQLKETLRKKR